jgi:NAD(P)H dehydrogenase (quinone)
MSTNDAASRRGTYVERTALSNQGPFIAEQVLNWSGLAVTHLRPTYFLEWLLYPFQLTLLVEKRDSPPACRQGAACAHRSGGPSAGDRRNLQSPNEHKGQTYPLFGPVEMDHEQMAAELSDALGCSATIWMRSVLPHPRRDEAAGYI